MIQIKIKMKIFKTQIKMKKIKTLKPHVLKMRLTLLFSTPYGRKGKEIA
jgi:hypothetical protein